MNPITLPTSPETRADLEAKNWHLDNSGTVSECWTKDDTWLMTIFENGSVCIQMIGSGCSIGLVAFAEVAAILHMTPIEQRKAEAYSALRDAITDAATDLDAAFVLLENGHPEDVKEHLSRAIGRLMLGGKREHVSVPFDLARRYREVWYNHNQRRVKCEREELERAIAILFRDAVVSSEQNASVQDQAATIQAERGPIIPGDDDESPQPRPSEDGGLSPSPLQPDGQTMFASVDRYLASYDTERVAGKLKKFLDGATEPREEETP